MDTQSAVLLWAAVLSVVAGLLAWGGRALRGSRLNEHGAVDAQAFTLVVCGGVLLLIAAASAFGVTVSAAT